MDYRKFVLFISFGGNTISYHIDSSNYKHIQACLDSRQKMFWFKSEDGHEVFINTKYLMLIDFKERV